MGRPGVVGAAQETLPRTENGFPARPVRILVPTSPGGLIDFTSRKFAEIATRHSGVPFVVINKPGAGGVVSFEETLRAPADGLTLQATTRSNIPKLIASRRTDLLSRMFWAAKLLDDPQCVIVNRHSETPDWAAVLRQAQSLDGRQLWLGPDIGGLDHVSAARIWAAAGIAARWIPYESGGQAIAALLGGMGATYTGNPSEVRGRPDLVVAAVCAPERLAQFPDAPTFAELGIEGLEDESMWRGFALHPDTPPEILAWYAELFSRVTADPAWREAWIKDGLTVLYAPEPEFRALVEKETENFTAFLRELGILPEAGQEIPRANPTMVRVLLVLALLGYIVALILLGAKERRFSRWTAEEWAVLSGWALVIFFLWQAENLPAGNELDRIGPAGIPLLWCGLFLPCLAGMTVQMLRQRSHRATIAAAAAAPEPTEPDANGLTAGLAALLLGGIFLWGWLGYFATTLLVLPLALWILGWRRWRGTVVLTAGWLAFVYLVFQRLLHVDLPQGWWGN
jgi:tripartite-type tricarboxylate transporter receptor subunit TctC